MILPIFAVAQPEGDSPTEETQPAMEEGTEGLVEEAGEPVIEDVVPEISTPPMDPVETVKYHFFILHTTDPTLPVQEWDTIARFPTNTSYTWQEPAYFGFWKTDPNPEDPGELVEPAEPEKPDEADFADLPEELYQEAMGRYDEAYKEYEDDLEGFASYSEIHPRLLEEYKQEKAAFDQDTYPNLMHYYFFERDVPNRKAKQAIYKLAVNQVEIEVLQSEPVDMGTVPVELGAPIDTPVEAVGPAPPLPSDLKLPTEFWYEDRTNDGGGAIALCWSTASSDNAITTYIPDPPPPDEPEEEKEAPVKPEYDLNKFVIDAWLYAPDVDIPGNLDDITVTVDLSRLGGEKDSPLEFVGIVDKEGAPDYNLGIHYSGTFTITDPKIGKHLIRAKATIEGKKARHGKITVQKILGAPINLTTPDNYSVSDNYYLHYFKLGIDTWDHQGTPRWIIQQDSPGVVANTNMWNWAKWNTLLIVILYMIAIFWFINRARKGAKLFVRRIAGLDHMEEAIGRATEMGKPILFVPGIGSMADVATIAAMNILGQVSRKVAEYDSRIIVPNKDPIVMTVAQEVTQEGFIDAGHPDKYNRDDVFFLTEDQFSFTAAVDGIMVRDKPATILFMGMFYAESLILAETGAGTGAIQIAGTDALHQLPFFITACDYTLIGEELYAASAYLSREPLLLGSLKGQDMTKAVIFAFLFVGVIMATFGNDILSRLFNSLS